MAYSLSRALVRVVIEPPQASTAHPLISLDAKFPFWGRSARLRGDLQPPTAGWAAGRTPAPRLRPRLRAGSRLPMQSPPEIHRKPKYKMCVADSRRSCAWTTVPPASRLTVQRLNRNIDRAGLEHYARTSDSQLFISVQGDRSKILQTEAANLPWGCPALWPLIQSPDLEIPRAFTLFGEPPARRSAGSFGSSQGCLSTVRL